MRQFAGIISLFPGNKNHRGQSSVDQGARRVTQPKPAARVAEPHPNPM